MSEELVLVILLFKFTWYMYVIHNYACTHAHVHHWCLSAYDHACTYLEKLLYVNTCMHTLISSDLRLYSLKADTLNC